MASSFSCHLIFSDCAQSLMSLLIDSSFGDMSALFTTKVTPTVAQGLFRSWKLRTISLFPKQVFMSWRRAWSRCVSCSARIAILCSLMVLFTVDHFSMPVLPLAGAVKPFMFRVAIFMFTLFWFFFGFGSHSLV